MYIFIKSGFQSGCQICSTWTRATRTCSHLEILRVPDLAGQGYCSTPGQSRLIDENEYIFVHVWFEKLSLTTLEPTCEAMTWTWSSLMSRRASSTKTRLHGRVLCTEGLEPGMQGGMWCRRGEDFVIKYLETSRDKLFVHHFPKLSHKSSPLNCITQSHMDLKVSNRVLARKIQQIIGKLDSCDSGISCR